MFALDGVVLDIVISGRVGCRFNFEDAFGGVGDVRRRLIERGVRAELGDGGGCCPLDWMILVFRMPPRDVMLTVTLFDEETCLLLRGEMDTGTDSVPMPLFGADCDGFSC